MKRPEDRAALAVLDYFKIKNSIIKKAQLIAGLF